MSWAVYVLIFLLALLLLRLATQRLPASEAKERLEIINTAIATAGIFVGAIWVWNEFSRERQGIPWITADQVVTSYSIPPNETLLDIRTTIENKGRIAVDLGKGVTWVQQILPLYPDVDKIINSEKYGKDIGEEKTVSSLFKQGNKTIDWTMVCERQHVGTIHLEPSEKSIIEEEFLIPAALELVRVYTHMKSPVNAEIGYTASTLHQISKERGNAPAPENTGNYRYLCGFDTPPPNDRGTRRN
jgi:hypothetical protein